MILIIRWNKQSPRLFFATWHRLSGLRLFEAAACCGSLKRAAQELNMTPGALSHAIDSLE